MQNGGLFRDHVGVGFFCTKPLNFGVEAHMEAPTGVALTPLCQIAEKAIRTEEEGLSLCLYDFGLPIKGPNRAQQLLNELFRKFPYTLCFFCIWKK
jgi:hypothetical protein